MSPSPAPRTGSRAPRGDGGWPALGSEEREWVSTIDPGRLTVYERIRLDRPYRAAIVPEIADVRVDLDPEVLTLAQDAATEMTRFDAEVAHLPLPMPAVLLRSESASSSQIEQLTSSARNIALAELGVGDKENARLVVANARAMMTALADGDEVTPTGLLAIHRELMVAEPDHAGRWREEQVWIGASDVSPHGADFVAPHHDHVPRLVEDLAAFAARVDVPALVHAALVHAQFETIHPFVDGNGRTGRVLLHTVLRRAGVVARATVPVSAGLLRDTGSYFRALTTYREGEPHAVVEQVALAALAAVRNGRELASDVEGIRERWRSTVRARRDAAAWRLLDALFARPVVDVALAATLTGTSGRAALTAVDTLVEAGVLTPVSGARWGRAWQATDVLAATDAFARRAGRRRAGR
ncbi:Fic family protein [Cellulomonas triticagri]|uniref:Fic family protein n=1 Tax=Cellulomonas triticagri TaxID=2483352 RepID=A0A3M2JK07_9CELL|nr:Fic family protein [Cellulomonas triticagri]RMI12471.1 Fic family protein [Cellulomonas triticagri]